MKEISDRITISSEEQFKSYMQQELQEIIDTLKANGINEYEDVIDTVKLFFEDYYQYMRVVMATDREIYEDYKISLYKLQEFSGMIDVISATLAKGTLSDIQEEIMNKVDELLGFSRIHRSRLKHIRQLGNESTEEILDAIRVSDENAWEQCAYKYKSWLLSTKLERINSTINLTNSNDKGILTRGYIIYNGLNKKFKELKSRQEELHKQRTKLNAYRASLNLQISGAIFSFEFNNVSYRLPGDLFKNFNQYLLSRILGNLLFDCEQMEIIKNKRQEPFYHIQNELNIRRLKEVTVEMLDEYLNKDIKAGSFWIQKFIMDILNIMTEAFGTKSHHIYEIRGLEHLLCSQLYTEITDLRNFIELNDKDVKNTHFNKKIKKIEVLELLFDKFMNSSSIDSLKIFWGADSFNEEFLKLYYKYISLASKYRLQKEEKDLENYIKGMSADYEKIKNGILNYLNDIEEHRIKCAQELFGISRDEIKALSPNELEQKWKELVENEKVTTQTAIEHLKKHISQNLHLTFGSSNIYELNGKLNEIISQISALDNEIKETEREISSLVNLSEFDQTSKSITPDLSVDEQKALCLYVFMKLEKKYGQIIAPAISELSKRREEYLLQNEAESYQSEQISPFGLSASSTQLLAPPEKHIYLP